MSPEVNFTITSAAAACHSRAMSSALRCATPNAGPNGYCPWCGLPNWAYRLDPNSDPNRIPHTGTFRRPTFRVPPIRIDGVRSRTGRTVGAHNFACGDTSDSAAALIRSARAGASFSDRSRSSLDASFGRERNLASVSYAPSSRTLNLSAACLATFSPPHDYARRILPGPPPPLVDHVDGGDDGLRALSGPDVWRDAGLDREDD